MLLDSAEEFGDQATQHRGELLIHCYRMLGTIDEAEDAVQETLARAWRGRQTFRRSVSLRAWLYRIATNVCLNAIEQRKRDRVEPGPCPDDLLVGIASPETGPEARFDLHESISLAFLTVLQVLPPRQRAVLLLRDVLALRAAAVLAMPPMPAVIGSGPIVSFLAESIFSMGPMRLTASRAANRAPAFALYVRRALFALLVHASDGHQVTRIDAFADPRVMARFDLPAKV